MPATRWLILQKARRHTTKGAPTPCGRTVSGTVSLPSRGAFHLSLTVLVRYRSHGSIQAWRVVPPGSDRVSRARPYSGSGSGVHPRVRLRGPNPVPPAFPCRSAPLDGSPPGAPAPGRSALQPRGRYRLAPARSTVWPRSPFARRYSGNLDVDFSSSGYLDVSVPRVVPLRTMCSSGGRQDLSWRVRPFGDPRVEGCVPLTADYRSLPRPSSAPCAKASAVRPGYLPAPSGRDAVSSSDCLDVWVSHTPGEMTHRRSSLQLTIFVYADWKILLVSLYRRIDQIVSIDPSCRYAALKVRGVTPGTGHARGRGSGDSGTPAPQLVRSGFVSFQKA